MAALAALLRLLPTSRGEEGRQKGRKRKREGEKSQKNKKESASNRQGENCKGNGERKI